MSKRLIMILALLFVAGITMAAYAEVQNVKVSGDLLIRGVARNDFQTGAGVGTSTGVNDKSRAILSAVRARVDADLTDNVSATVRLLNERAWGLETSASSTEVQLDLAYVTLKEFLYSPLTLVVGRQELRYGNALIIGDPDTNAIASSVSALPSTLKDLSVRKSFDAVKAVLNYDPLVLDLVYSKIEENTTNVADDVTLMGLNAAYTVNKELLTEAYLWSRNREAGSSGISSAAPANGERLNVLGARGVFLGIPHLTLGLEGAWQFGDHIATTTLYPDEVRTAGTKSKVNAYALQITSMYALPIRYGPVVNFNYTRLSGDKDKATGDNYRGWNPMFEDQSGGLICNRILAYSNAQIFNLGGTLQPMEDLKVSLNYYHIRLLQTFTTTVGGDLTRTLSGVYGDQATTIKPVQRHLADELDLNILYDYTEDVQLGLRAGLFIPAAAYDNSNDRAAEQLIGSMKVTF